MSKTDVIISSESNPFGVCQYRNLLKIFYEVILHNMLLKHAVCSQYLSANVFIINLVRNKVSK